MGWRKKLQKLTKGSRNVDTPWTDSMSKQYMREPPVPTASQDGAPGDENTQSTGNTAQPTVAAFSPRQQTSTSGTRPRSTVLIHQKSPLLVATPPQVTRALAYSHPFILPLNHLAGLLSWTTGDVWESFLLLASFWFVVLYGAHLVLWAGPVVLVVGLMLGMYSRRYSPLSSTVWSQDKQVRRRADSEQRKSLDEMLHTLQTFTSRCDVLLDPFLRLTEFLSTQSSATSATTRPALTTLFLRILGLTPFWIAATLPPWRILTTQRVVLILGTLGLTWHSVPARVTRTILWRSRTVRRIVSLITGLRSTGPSTLPSAPPPLPLRKGGAPATDLKATGSSPGVRFTFTIYENQRHWLGLGWIASLLAYERQAWTDEHLNTCPDPEHLTLPDTDLESTKWRWVPESKWHVEGASSANDKEKSSRRPVGDGGSGGGEGGGGGDGDDIGWTYYDNKWRDGRKTDGWGRYTRRRKWIRDAELVDVTNDSSPDKDGSGAPADAGAVVEGDAVSIASNAKRKAGWFGTTSKPRRQSEKNKSIDKSDVASATGSGSTAETTRSSPEDDHHTPERYRLSEFDRSIGEGLAEGLS